MKIRCENCGAKYSIASNLLKKKVTKFRCKKCQHIMVVRGDEEDSSSSEQQAEQSSQEQVPSQEQYDEAAQNPYAGLADMGLGGEDDAMSEATQMTDISAWRAEQQANMENNAEHQQSSSSSSYDTPSQSEQQAYGYDHASQEQYDAQHYEQQATGADYQEAGYDASAHSYDDAWGADEDYSDIHSDQDDALDDEFDRAFEEGDGENFETAAQAAADYSNIAPNYQDQSVVPLSQVRAGEDVPPQEDISTKVFNINALETLRAEREHAQEDRLRRAREKISAREAKYGKSSSLSNKPEEPEWYVLVGEDQQGPFTFSRVADGIRDKTYDKETLVWKDSFSDWMPLSEVSDFDKVFKGGPLSQPSLPVIPSTPAKISFGPDEPEQTEPEPEDDLQALAAQEISKLAPPQPEAPSSPAAQLLADPEPSPLASPTPSIAPNSPLGPASVSSPNLAAPPMSGTYGAYNSSAPFTPPPAAGAFAGSPFEQEKDPASSMKMLIISLIVLLILILVGGGFGFYWLFSQTAQKTVIVKQPVKTVIQQPIQPKVALGTRPQVPTTPTVIKQPAPVVQRPAVPTPQPQTAPQPPKKTTPTGVRYQPPPKRRSRRSRRYRRRRRRRRRRRYRRSRRRRSRYIPPRRRAPKSAAPVAPPPPPPPAAGGGAPPPPPPPPPPAGGGGSSLPPPPGPPGLNNTELGSLLGGGGSSPRPRPRPRPRRSNLPRTLTRPQVARVIRSNIFRIKQCQENYASGLRRVVVSWYIQRSGRPNRIRVRPTANARFSSCVRRTVSRWRFPRFTGRPIRIGGVPVNF